VAFAIMPTEYGSNLKVVVCCLAICQGEFIVPNLLYIKNIFGATHQCTLCIGGILLLCEPIGWWHHLLQASNFT
jgi:hypothetical protein